METKTSRIKAAFWLNIIIFVLEFLATLMMMTGFSFSTEEGRALSDMSFKALKFYTVDSNILMGITSLFLAIDLYKVIKGKKNDVSKALYVLALEGTVGVTLTMIITVFYLAPMLGIIASFKDSNFFFHLLNPLLSIVTFVFFLKTKKINFAHTFTGIISMILYSIYYAIQALLTMENGVIQKSHDWYGFFFIGINSVFVVMPIFILLTYSISFVLWLLNRRKLV